MNRIKVSKVAKQIRGVSYKPEDLHDMLDDNSVTLLRANNIQDGKVDFEDVLYVDKSKVSQVQYLQKGDILVCASSGSKSIVGKAASIDFDGEYTFGAFCKVVRPIPDMTDYLGVYFQSQIYRDIISKAAMGANINNIRNEHIDNLEIPEKTSKEISSIIQRIKLLQYIIDRRNLELQKLDELVKARFVEMFGDSEYNTKHWPVVKLSDICEVGSSKRIYKNEQSSSGVPFLRISDLNERIDGKVKNPEIFISIEKYDELKLQGMVPIAGDVLVTSRGTLGRCYIVTEEDVFYFQDGMISWLSKIDARATSLYLSYLFSMRGIQKQIETLQAGSTVAYLSITMLKKLDVMLPPPELQRRFLSFAEQIDKLKLSIKKSLEQMETLKKALMQQYFG